MKTFNKLYYTLGISSFLFLLHCSNDLFKVGGTLSGLSSGNIILELNGIEELSLSENGAFVFNTMIDNELDYSVAVKTQPDGQICTVANAVGVIAVQDVDNISVDCTTAYDLGGTVSGLSTGSVVLQNNGANDLTLSSNGNYTFFSGFPESSTYNVTILTQPGGLYCTVENATGTLSADVTDVNISCYPKKFFFITAAGFNGNLGGISGADASCNLDTNRPNIGASYKALLVDGSNRVACSSANCITGGLTEHIDWSLAANTAYVRANGTTLIGITNTLSLFTFPMTSTYDLDLGANEAARIWTGLTTDFQTASNICSNWAVTSGSGQHARRDAVDTQAISYNSQLCSEVSALACVEQ